MKLKNWLPLMLVIAILGNVNFIVFADETVPKSDENAQHHPKGKAMGKEMSPEMRQKMSEMHQMMADCLKSDKAIGECKKEMMKNCPMMKEGGHCPMMGEMDEMMGHSKHPPKKGEKSQEHQH